MTAPKRRWLSFSLRTMFVVVTVAAVLTHWLYGSWSQARAREHMGFHQKVVAYSAAPPPQRGKISLLLRLFGATPVDNIYIDEDRATPDDEQHLKVLFPESQIKRVPFDYFFPFEHFRDNPDRQWVREQRQRESRTSKQ